MNGIVFWLPITLLALAAGVGIGYIIKQILITRAIENEKQAADKILGDAKKQAEEIALQARNKALETRQNPPDCRRRYLKTQK